VLESLKPVGLTIVPIQYLQSLESGKTNGNGQGVREKILREIATKHGVEGADKLDFKTLRGMVHTDPELAEADDEFNARLTQVERDEQRQTQLAEQTREKRIQQRETEVNSLLGKFAKDIPHYDKLYPLIVERAKKLYDKDGETIPTEVTELLKDAADLSYLRTVMPEILAARDKQAEKEIKRRYGIPDNLSEEPSAEAVRTFKPAKGSEGFTDDLEGEGPDLLHES
jgi:hypothetical protein